MVVSVGAPFVAVDCLSPFTKPAIVQVSVGTFAPGCIVRLFAVTVSAAFCTVSTPGTKVNV